MIRFPTILVVVFLSTIFAKLEVQFKNLGSSVVYLYWQSSEAQVRIADIEQGKSFTLSTFPGHIFIAKDGNSLDTIDAYLIEDATSVVEIRPKENCGDEPTTARINDLIRKRSQQEKVELDRENNEQRRKYLNQVQPAKVPKFTTVGYDLRKMPSPVWEEVLQFWEQNKEIQEKEGWDAGNSYVNHWESPTFMVFLPGHLKTKIFDTVRPILEEWCGQPLIPTSCYGIRVYKNDSYLRSHVDILQTHAISAILQVSQDVDEPWGLQIHNHAGQETEMLLQPRDLVLYESASCIHARETRMRGRHYANAFIHFRPRDNWNFPANYI